MVTLVLNLSVVELDVPIGIYPRFYVELVYRATDAPLPSQIVEDP